MPEVSPNPLTALEEAGPPYPFLSALPAGTDQGICWAGLWLRSEPGQPAGSGGLGAWAEATSDGGRVQQPTEAWWHHPGLLDSRPRTGQ